MTLRKALRTANVEQNKVNRLRNLSRIDVGAVGLESELASEVLNRFCGMRGGFLENSAHALLLE